MVHSQSASESLARPEFDPGPPPAAARASTGRVRIDSYGDEVTLTIAPPGKVVPPAPPRSLKPVVPVVRRTLPEARPARRPRRKRSTSNKAPPSDDQPPRQPRRRSSRPEDAVALRGHAVLDEAWARALEADPDPVPQAGRPPLHDADLGLYRADGGVL